MPRGGARPGAGRPRKQLGEEGQTPHAPSSNADQTDLRKASSEEMRMKYIHRVKMKLIAEIKGDPNRENGMPQCYRNGTCWFRPMDPLFAFIRTGEKPELNAPKIFVWLPDVIHRLLNPQDCGCLRCQCGGKLISNGKLIRSIHEQAIDWGLQDGAIPEISHASSLLYCSREAISV